MASVAARSVRTLIANTPGCPPQRATMATISDYTPWLTKLARGRRPSPIRRLQPLLATPGMISLGGGMPNPKLFPFTGMSFTLADGTQLQLDDAAVAAALQYSNTPGLPELLQRLEVVQRSEHGLGERPLSLAVGTGSQDLLSKAFAMLLSEGDSLIVEAPTYSGSLAALEPMGVNLVTVPTDGGGMDTDALQACLEGWEASHPGKPKPRVIYTIPTGSNPTGASLEEGRRDALLAIAAQHDCLVLEDDPYYFLQYAPTRSRSLLSRDTDGRVLRFDSFSKVLSSGLRVGVVSGPPALLDNINLASQSSCLHPSGVSQAAVLALFQHWGVGESDTSALGGLDGHLQEVVRFYASQCDAFMSAAEAAGLPDLARYTRPSAGMFVWMECLGVSDTTTLIEEKAAAKKFLMVPGSSFFPRGTTSPHVRAAFSTATPEQMQTATAGLAELLREETAR